MLHAEFLQLSFVPLLIGALAAITCALIGNVLVLRRQALIGDAISHLVLPGVVGAFLLTGAVSGGPMMIGASVAAIVAVLLYSLIIGLGGVETGAAMGVVFTTMFAAGALALELSDTSNVHLDVQHALYGNLESLIWLEASDWRSIFDTQALADLPPQLGRLSIAFLGISLFLGLFWKELVIATFDPSFAKAIGIRTNLLSVAVVVAAALAAVAAFDAVGSIIVIAMFVCPPAAARLMTDSLTAQLRWSSLFALLSAVIGYVSAGYGPQWLGFDHAVSAAGMMATCAGMILALTAVFGPRRHPLRNS